MTPRIPPLEPPYEQEVESMLSKWMTSGAAEPLKLFRTLAHNMELAGRMRPLGAGILGRTSKIDPREREIVINRTCARCRGEYEWGVHVVVFGKTLGIPQETLEATATKDSTDPLWSDRERLLVRLVDELHDTAQVSDALWADLARHWTIPQLLELLVTVGWYHTISFVANAARVPLETWAARFP